MKKKVYRERYNTLTLDRDKYFTFTVDDVDIYKEGAIEKVVKEIAKDTNAKEIKIEALEYDKETGKVKPKKKKKSEK